MPPRFEELPEFDKRKSKATGLPKLAITVPAPFTVTVAVELIGLEQDMLLLQLQPANGAFVSGFAAKV